jgi:hypothetical protein
MPADIAEQLGSMLGQPEEGMGESPAEETGEEQLDPIADDPAMQTIVRDLAKHFIGLDKWVRRSEVIDARRQRFYWRNDQYIYWKSDAVGFIPAFGGSAVDAGNSAVETPRYTDVYNIYTPYGESILATLIQNPPSISRRLSRTTTARPCNRKSPGCSTPTAA